MVVHKIQVRSNRPFLEASIKQSKAFFNYLSGKASLVEKLGKIIGDLLQLRCSESAHLADRHKHLPALLDILPQENTLLLYHSKVDFRYFFDQVGNDIHLLIVFNHEESFFIDELSIQRKLVHQPP